MRKQNQKVEFGTKDNALLGLIGITQAQVADECGINKSSLSRFFRGVSDIRTSQLVKVLHTIGIDLLQIINRQIDERLGKEKPTPHIGADLETIVQHLDKLESQTLLETIIVKAKKIKSIDLKKEMKNVEEYRKLLSLKARK